MKTLRLIAGFTAVLATCVLWTVALADQTSAVPASAKPSALLAGHPVSPGGASPFELNRPAEPSQPDAGLLARGHYLVFRTGLCIDCHSPRNEKGEHIESQHLMGAPIPFAPTVPMPWVPAAPRLAGLPAGYSEEQMVHFLMTGDRPDGRGKPLPPMPPFRFDHDDAAAIAAYLHSLPAK